MNRKDLIREYKETVQPIGVFQIRNLTNGKILIGSSTNLTGILNRHRFALEYGNHQSQLLQKDWNESGAENFAFEILEELSPRENLDIKRELEFLEDLWLEKEQPFGERGYNVPKRSREERLRMIAANKNL